VITGEDPADFEQLLRNLEGDLEPGSSIEYELVARIAGYFWRLRRIPIFEAALLETRRTELEDAATEEVFEGIPPERHGWLAAIGPHVRPKQSPPEPAKEETVPPETPIRANETVREFKKVDMGRALIRDSQENDTLGKLSRYEAALLNAFDRTLRQFFVIQNARVTRAEPRQIAGTPVVVSKK